ncbi:hypothetical protein CCZ01_09935, partial [Helicobacter monodelphidis]|uniref:hypothetical protein n=1 Tax=Helicobacter sp. 15-1451 TaxID=2004995 RepID=UPI000DCCA206
MKKLIFSISVSALMASSVFAAEDILAKVTHGALSDYSKGVHILSLEEEKQVKGGYNVRTSDSIEEYGGRYIYVWAYLDDDPNNREGDANFGICGIGTSSCAIGSQRRLAEWKGFTGSDSPRDFGPAYIVKKNKATSSLGNSF